LGFALLSIRFILLYMTTPKLKMKGGSTMPAIGLGTWRSEKGEVGAAVLSAIKVGYRHFDCSPIYGNEKEIGEAFSMAFREGLVKRQELWITSKLWNDNHAKEHVLPALRQTLADLQLDYLDLYLIHWPVAFRHGVVMPKEENNFLKPEEAPLDKTWKGMEAALAEGLARHIGVSNFSSARLEKLLEVAEHAPEVNQVECHPFLAQKELLEVCKRHGVVLTGYCPLGSGKEKGGAVPDIIGNEIIQKVAKNHGVSSAQVALAWAANRGTVAIPKSTNKSRQSENLAAAEISLTESEMAEINSLDSGYRYIDGTVWTGEGSPYSLEWIWEGGGIT
jgi:alcohol dehydrogenase (NADP+)